MYFYLIVALQGFCIYHCYTNKNNYYWIFAIIFLPLLGSLLYLFMNVVQKRDVEKAQENLIAVINPSKKIKDLEKKLKFSESFENRVALADALLAENMYSEAIAHYESSLKDVFKNDFYVLSKLQEAHYFSSAFEMSITYAERIKQHVDFKKSRAAFLYGMAFEKIGEIKEAEKLLRQFDAPYNYFMERLELARFLVRNDKNEDALVVYRELVSESESMSKQSLRAHRHILKKAKEELGVLL
ncbi:hypothetical protein [uncultured Croceitalea sp.]|uniref:hypothetical protein n=1 Tax=uncultured Croceitalea sp. TaxID=1798908 RepID=UPI0033066B79